MASQQRFISLQQLLAQVCEFEIARKNAEENELCSRAAALALEEDSALLAQHREMLRPAQRLLLERIRDKTDVDHTIRLGWLDDDNKTRRLIMERWGDDQVEVEPGETEDDDIHEPAATVCDGVNGRSCADSPCDAEPCDPAA